MRRGAREGHHLSRREEKRWLTSCYEVLPPLDPRDLKSESDTTSLRLTRSAATYWSTSDTLRLKTRSIIRSPANQIAVPTPQFDRHGKGSFASYFRIRMSANKSHLCDFGHELSHAKPPWLRIAAQVVIRIGVTHAASACIRNPSRSRRVLESEVEWNARGILTPQTAPCSTFPASCPCGAKSSGSQ